MQAIFLVCGAGGPQLKRDPLGCRFFEALVTCSLYQALCLPVAALTLSACFCDSRLIQTSQSPGSQFQVKVLEVNCGATTSLQRNLILSELNPRNAKGRAHPAVVFAVDDTIRFPTPADTQPVLGVQPTWISDDTLVINYDRRARVLLSASTFAGVAIRLNPTHP